MAMHPHASAEASLNLVDRHGATVPAHSAFEGLAYPLTKEEAVQRLADYTIPYDGETRVTLADIMRGVGKPAFVNAAEAQRAVDERWGRVVRNLAEVARHERAATRGPP